jgi:tRNA (mo5U34)-methyltransferase
VAYELHHVPRLDWFPEMRMNNSNPAVTETDVARLGDWFHNLHLPGGVETAPDHPLGDFPARKWRAIEGCLPKDMTGWRVLDVGCNAGFYSFALAERGARVLGVDVNSRYLAQARWAAGQFCFKHVPQFRQLSVYRLGDLAFDFDLVWFMGVAYHLRHPLLALDLVRCCLAPRYMMFQTMTFPDEPESPVPQDLPLGERRYLAKPGWPKLAFVEKRLAGDPTNWWAANDACVEAMLRSSGFNVLSRPAHEVYWCALNTAASTDEMAGELEEVLGPA